jgi:TRAP-type C4-dicarboxylate transport system permease small subunit
MQMPVPDELIWLLVLITACAVVLVFSQRTTWCVDGRTRPWLLVEDLVGYLLFMGMFVASTVQIVIRYGLSDVITAPWTEEFSRLVLVWLALWGAAAVQRTDDHIHMTVVFDLLPVKARRWVRVAGDVIILAALAPVVWYGWHTAQSLDIMYTIALGVPLSVFAYPVPVGGALMMLHTLRLIVLRVQDRSVVSDPGSSF